VPTNVGSGGGVQPLAVLRANTDPGEVVDQINETILGMPFGDVLEVIEMQKEMTLEHRFTYLLGPIKICTDLWSDCLSLEKMWLEGELDGIVKIEEEELEIARLQPWRGSPAIIASDGLFCFR